MKYYSEICCHVHGIVNLQEKSCKAFDVKDVVNVNVIMATILLNWLHACSRPNQPVKHAARRSPGWKPEAKANILDPEPASVSVSILLILETMITVGAIDHKTQLHTPIENQPYIQYADIRIAYNLSIIPRLKCDEHQTSNTLPNCYKICFPAISSMRFN